MASGLQDNSASAEVKFSCQGCQSPIVLDASLESTDFTVDSIVPILEAHKIDTSYDSVVKATNSLTGAIVTESSTELSYSTSSELSDFEFLKVDKSDLGEQECNRSNQFLSKIFNFMSENSDIDHPICHNCADYIIASQTSKVEEKIAECNLVKDYFEYLESMGNSTTEDMDILDKDLDLAKAEEVLLKSHLDKLKDNIDHLDKDIVLKETFLKEIETKEQDISKEYNKLRLKHFQLEEIERSIARQIDYTNTELNSLRDINILDSTFSIWFDGHFGLINGFRMGKLSTHPVDWAEINAGWGQCALLLHSILKQISLNHDKYRIVPMGCNSYVLSLKDNKSLPLYFQSGVISMFHARFDQGMIAFCDVLHQVDCLIQKTNNCCLPYPILANGEFQDKNKAKKFKIKTQMNSDEFWTKALNMMLIDLKWAIAFVTSLKCASVVNPE